LDQSFNRSINIQNTDPRCRGFRLSHAGSIRVALSLPPDPSRFCSSWLFPPKMPERALAADSFANFSVPVRSVRCMRLLVTPHWTSLGTAAQLTNRVGAALFQVSSLVR
jgi:hypothetical protein